MTRAADLPGWGWARIAGSPAALVGVLGGIFAADVLLKAAKHSLVVTLALDHPSHAGTTILLARMIRGIFSPATLLGLLAGSLAIDVDHLPGLLGSRGMAGDGKRPCTHSLATVAALGLASLALRANGRRFALACMLGVISHLVRDMATGGVPLWWPVTRRNVRLPYLYYASLLAIALMLPLPRRWSSIETPSPASVKISSLPQ